MFDDKYHIKLIDFGTCKVFNSDWWDEYNFNSNENLNSSSQLERSSSFVGTEEYVSPEILQEQEVTFGCDLWSLGVILYELSFGKTPFRSSNQLETFRKIQEIDYQLPPQNYQNTVDQDLLDLIKCLLKKEPEKRIGFLDLEEIKAHPYFKNTDFNMILFSDVPYNKPKVIKSPPKGALRQLKLQRSKVQEEIKVFETREDNTFDDISQDMIYKTAVYEEYKNSCQDFQIQLKLNQSNYQTNQEMKQSKKQRLRSNSCDDSLKFKSSVRSKENESIVIKGLLKKKGMIFFNDRLVTLTQDGIIQYYEPKNLKKVKAKIYLTNTDVKVRIIGKSKDAFEIVTNQETYLFKELKKGDKQIIKWEEELKKFKSLTYI